MKRQNIRTLSLIFVTLIYLLLGAAVFDQLESKEEMDQNRKIAEREDDWMDRLGITVEQYDELYKYLLKMKPYRSGTQWEFSGSFYFATTVITTIGYGHTTPRTVKGKIMCMLYALLGIPICIIMFQSIGERMNSFLIILLQRMKKAIPNASAVSQTNLMCVCGSVAILLWSGGAAAYMHYEQWTYLDSVYYCFITLTTVGFGDFVALKRNDELTYRPDYVLFSLLYIVFGLAIVSSAMNLLVLKFLTMNTDDERRDKLEAAIQAMGNSGIRFPKRKDRQQCSTLANNFDNNNGFGDDYNNNSSDKNYYYYYYYYNNKHNNNQSAVDTHTNSEQKYTTHPGKQLLKQPVSHNPKTTHPGARHKRKDLHYTIIRRPGSVQHLAHPTVPEEDGD